MIYDYMHYKEIENKSIEDYSIDIDDYINYFDGSLKRATIIYIKTLVNHINNLEDRIKKLETECSRDYEVK